MKVEQQEQDTLIEIGQKVLESAERVVSGESDSEVFLLNMGTGEKAVYFSDLPSCPVDRILRVTVQWSSA